MLISRIPKRVDKQDIRSLLSTFGNIHSCHTVEEDRGVLPNRQSGHRAECYRVTATYDSPEQAKQAVRNLSRRPYQGGILHAEYFNGPFNTFHRHNNNNQVHAYLNGHDHVYKYVACISQITFLYITADQIS